MYMLEAACRPPVLVGCFLVDFQGRWRERVHSGKGVLQSMCGRSYGIWNSIMEMPGVYKKIPDTLSTLDRKEFLDFCRQP